MFDGVELRPEGETWMLDQVPVGPGLGVFLGGLDIQELSYGDRIAVLQARQQLISHHQAELARDIEAIHRAHIAETPTDWRTLLDHTVLHSEGGPTCPCNLVPLCRHHHRLKEANWTNTTNPDGTITWTSPLGTTYTTDHDP
jgi:hypothetical protein